MSETINTLRLIRPCAPCFGLGCTLCQHTSQRILSRTLPRAETFIQPCRACRGSGERSTSPQSENCRCRSGPAHSHAPCPHCQGTGEFPGVEAP
jgi:hypothetical protein